MVPGMPDPNMLAAAAVLGSVATVLLVALAWLLQRRVRRLEAAVDRLGGDVADLAARVSVGERET